MPRLLNLGGSPQTWAELHERNRVYWETHSRDGELIVKLLPRLISIRCSQQRHSLCAGGFRRDVRGVGEISQRCRCECHEAV